MKTVTRLYRQFQLTTLKKWTEVESNENRDEKAKKL